MTDTTDRAMAELSETIVRAARLIKAYRQLMPTPMPGLEVGLASLLFHLEEGPRRVTELAAGVHSDVSTVSRQITHLTRMGLVVKQPDPADGRALQVSLCRRGQELLLEIRRQREESFAVFLDGWSPDEIEDFHTHLKRLAASVERAHAEHLGPRHP